ncbi:MAG: efflux RND transporter periplasmic adaptor subunit, partial [Burkholderiaceae bacterium]
LVKHLDGRRTLDEIYQNLLIELRDTAPGQQEVISAISQLAESNLLQTDQPTDLRVLQRLANTRRHRILKSKINPLSFQIGVLDPTRLLDFLEPLGRILFNQWVSFLWIALITLGIATGLSHSDQIAYTLSNTNSNQRFLLLIWIAYPALKLLHEIAHGLAVKKYGGDVSEMGIRLLVLMPVPYVDASASTLFASKYERAVVGAAGIVTELAIAAVATILWSVMESGLTRDLMLAVMLVGSVSTLLFNGNPLMKFDGYYVFSDLLELPNLAERSKRLFVDSIKEMFLSSDKRPHQSTASGEAPWLIGYALASWTYRLFVMTAIATFVASYSLTASSLVLMIAFWSLFLSPAISATEFLLASPQLNGRRALGLTASFAMCAIILLVILMPAPSSTIATGIVWLPDNAKIRPQVEGSVESILLRDGERVKQGQPVLSLANPDLILRADQLTLELAALRTEQVHYLNTGSGKASLLQDQISQKTKELSDATSKKTALNVKAPAAGVFVLPAADDLNGAWIAAGEVVGYVLKSDTTSVRVALPNEYGNKVNAQTQNISVVFSDEPDKNYAGEIVSREPVSTFQIPAPALSIQHGGPIIADPDDPTLSLEPTFIFDIRVRDRRLDRPGVRAFVRFDHPREALAAQAASAVRRLFLRQFAS